MVFSAALLCRTQTHFGCILQKPISCLHQCALHQLPLRSTSYCRRSLGLSSNCQSLTHQQHISTSYQPRFHLKAQQRCRKHLLRCTPLQPRVGLRPRLKMLILFSSLTSILRLYHPRTKCWNSLPARQAKFRLQEKKNDGM